MLDKALEIVSDAGNILLEKKKVLSSLNPTYKEGGGLVSEADLACEDFLREKISKLTPDFFILSEEDTKQSKVEEAKEHEWVWHVDPLDGTNNYLNDLDYYSISVALSYKNELKLGIVYAPERGELYFSEKGKGSFLRNSQGEDLKLSVGHYQKREFKHSFFVTCLNSLSHNKNKLDVFYRVNKEALSVRRMGSAALDLCLTAKGVFSGFWEHGLNSWDIAAGALICSEADLNLTDFWGNPFDPYCETIVAVRKDLDDKLYQLIEPSFPSRL